MAYIAFASAKGSPGVTTTIAALAATWPPDRDLYIAELDPAGGDLVVRLDLSPEPSLVGLAAAGRRGLDVETFLAYTQHLPSGGGVPSENGSGGRRAREVLLGPVAAEQAVAALAALRLSLPRALAALDADVLVDCGRLDPGSPVEELACQADLLVVVARPVLTEVHHLAARLATLRPKALSLLVVGEAPYPVAEVAQAVRAAPLGTLPVDDRAAAALTTGHPNPGAALRRSRLLRSARLIAEGLAEWLDPTAGVPAPSGGPVEEPGLAIPPPPSQSSQPPPPPPPPPPSAGPPGPPSADVPPPPPLPVPVPEPAPAPSAQPPQTSGRISLPIPPRAPAAMDPPPDLLAPLPGVFVPPDGEPASPRHFRRNNDGGGR